MDILLYHIISINLVSILSNVLNTYILSDPVINDPLTNGSFITGSDKDKLASKVILVNHFRLLEKIKNWV